MMHISPETIEQTIVDLREQHAAAKQDHIATGVRQLAQRWREEDGDQMAFANFCLQHYIADHHVRQQTRDRLLANMESLLGHLHQVYRDFNWPLHVDAGEMLGVDHLFSNYDVTAHLVDDFYKTGLAKLILLNFPLEKLETKISTGAEWTRDKWAELRLAEQFEQRIPAEVKQQRTGAYTRAEAYVYGYNLFLGNIVKTDGSRVFSEPTRLISHWGLRDKIKALYAEEEALADQQIIQQIMYRIINQDNPQQIIDSDQFLWDPVENRLTGIGGDPVEPISEENRRYAILQQVFLAEKQLDEYTTSMPSLIDRRFDGDREIAEADVEALLISVLSAPIVKDIARMISRRLDRPLQPFDIWYNGFKPGGDLAESELNQRVASAFPDVATFQSRISDILKNLGFSKEKAAYLQQHIQVDPARGAGHAMGAMLRGDAAHLRTRVPEGGMGYDGFNTAMHELGHTVEQVFSLNEIDFYSLQGVPNTAFTEAFAFLFQSKDLQVLDMATDDPRNAAREAVHDLWQTLEIAGVSLLDMRIWRWMYANPEANPRQIKEALIMLAREIWNEFYAPLYDVRDQEILAIYSHILFCGMYIPDYALGHIISFQIRDYFRDQPLAEEMERMCKLGKIAPQLWMQQAIGAPISVEPMLKAAEEGLQLL